MDLGDTSAAVEHAAVADDVANGHVVVAAFTSRRVFEAPCVQQISASSA